MAFNFLACTLEVADKFKNGSKFRPDGGYGICFLEFMRKINSPDTFHDHVRGILYQTGFWFYPG